MYSVLCTVLWFFILCYDLRIPIAKVKYRWRSLVNKSQKVNKSHFPVCYVGGVTSKGSALKFFKGSVTFQIPNSDFFHSSQKRYYYLFVKAILLYFCKKDTIYCNRYDTRYNGSNPKFITIFWQHSWKPFATFTNCKDLLFAFSLGPVGFDKTRIDGFFLFIGVIFSRGNSISISAIDIGVNRWMVRVYQLYIPDKLCLKWTRKAANLNSGSISDTIIFFFKFIMPCKFYLMLWVLNFFMITK